MNLARHFSSVEAIIFDLDDTLIGSERMYQELYRELGFDLDILQQARAVVKNQLGLGHVAARNRLLYFKQYLELRKEFSAQRLLQLNASYEEKLGEKIHAELQLTSHRELLQKLSQKYTLGLVTNENLRTQMLKLNQIDPNGALFRFVVTSEELGVEKPHDLIIDEAIARANTTTERILMVGDSVKSDLVPFAQRGCKVLGTRQFRDESQGINNFNWIHRLEELIES